MKKKIEDYFSSPEINLPVSQIIKKGIERERIRSKPCIQAAIDEYYNNRASINIKRFKIAWWIWRRARQIENDKNRAQYTAKYEGERKELKSLRLRKIKYEKIQRANIHDMVMIHCPYWIMIGSILALLYFFGN